MKILSFDVGGTKISYAIINDSGEIISNITRLSTPKICSDIEKIFMDAVRKNEFDGVSIATAGVVYKEKLQGKPNNLPQGYQNIKFSEIFKKPYLIENDANSALWAEYKKGSLQNTSNAVMLTLGTDTGCGLIINGSIYKGKQGAAGEVNFAVSGRALARIAQEKNLLEFDCFKIYELSQNGDNTASEVYEIWQQNLVEAIVQINSLLDIEGVALSGSLSKIVNYEFVTEEIRKKIPHNPPFVKSAYCGTNAGLIGAALLLADKIKGEK